MDARPSWRAEIMPPEDAPPPRAVQQACATSSAATPPAGRGGGRGGAQPPADTWTTPTTKCWPTRRAPSGATRVDALARASFPARWLFCSIAASAAARQGAAPPVRASAAAHLPPTYCAYTTTAVRRQKIAPPDRRALHLRQARCRSCDPARAPTLSSVPSSVKPAPLTRAERVRRFGVDIPADRLEWTGGVASGRRYDEAARGEEREHARDEDQVPAARSKYFSMAFPETIKLTPGLAVLEVHFRPGPPRGVRRRRRIPHRKGRSSCRSARRSRRSRSHVPDQPRLWLLPDRRDRRQDLRRHQRRRGARSTFSWTFEEPFTLTPASGSIAVGATQTITGGSRRRTDASTSPPAAGGPGHTSHSMKLGGIGKFPFVEASAEKLDFGRMLVGTGGARHFKLCNKSLVFARFKIVRREDDCEVRSPAPLAPRPARGGPARARMPPPPAAAPRPPPHPLHPLHPCRRCSRRLPPPASSPPTASKPSPSTTSPKWRGPSRKSTTTSSRPAATRW